MARLRLAPALLAVLCARDLPAHDLWIEPSSFTPAPGTEVTAALLVGVGLKGDPLPRNPELVERFALVSERGEREVGGEAFDDPAGRVRVVEPGPSWLVYQSFPSPLQLDAEKFEAYLREEGLERVIEERRRRGESQAAVRELFHRCAKSLLGATSSALKADVVTRPLGLTLELVPARSPLGARGAKTSPPVPLTLLFRGRPLEGALVVAVPKADPAATVSGRTDRKGAVALRLDRPGFWLLKAVHMERAPAGRNAEWMSWWASITLEAR